MKWILLGILEKLLIIISKYFWGNSETHIVRIATASSLSAADFFLFETAASSANFVFIKLMFLVHFLITEKGKL